MSIDLHVFDTARRRILNKLKCSLLYPVAPRAVATGLHESFPSYLTRVATRHGVGVGQLFKLLSEIYPDCVLPLHRFSRGLLFSESTHSNSLRIIADASCVSAVLQLQQATLSRLVALYREARCTAAWCPECIKEWLTSGEEVYRPLLWSLTSVECCPTHGVLLQSKCSVCDGSFYHASPKSWGVNCSHCGEPIVNREGNNPKLSEDDFRFRFAKLTMELFRCGWQLDGNAASQLFGENIDRLVKTVGDEYRTADLVALPRPTIHKYRRLERRPLLPGLMRLSLAFGIAPIDWISKPISASEFSNYCPLPEGLRAKGMQRRHPKPELLKRKVLAHLSRPSSKPLTIAELANQIGTASDRLNRVCPELVRKITKRRAATLKQQQNSVRAERMSAMKKAICELRANGHGISRAKVLKILQAQGYKSVWRLKELYTELQGG